MIPIRNPLCVPAVLLRGVIRHGEPCFRPARPAMHVMQLLAFLADTYRAVPASEIFPLGQLIH